MNLSAWLQYLEKVHPVSIDMGLDRVAAVADKLALDFSQQTVITVAGTNGKGSTATFLEKLLENAGKSVGVYRSPHLLHYNERVSVRGKAVSNKTLCAAFARVEACREAVSLSYFEFATLAALLIFTQSELDYLILEVGLGGRLDAVNIVDADIAVITNIALDHTEWLGNTREQIGLEKAGIMRAARPVVYGEEDMPVSVRQRAESLASPLYQYGKTFNAAVHDGHWYWQGQDNKGKELKFSLKDVRHTLLERFPANAALALQAFLLLGLQTDAKGLEASMQNVMIPGRFQILPRGYTLVLDVAHNPHAMQQTVKNIQNNFAGKKLTVLLAMLNGKDHEQVINILAPIVRQWFVAGLTNSRGTSVKILYNALRKSGQNQVATFESVKEAFQAAEDTLEADDVLLVTGSFYTVSGVLELV